MGNQGPSTDGEIFGPATAKVRALGEALYALDYAAQRRLVEMRRLGDSKSKSMPGDPRPQLGVRQVALDRAAAAKRDHDLALPYQWMWMALVTEFTEMKRDGDVYAPVHDAALATMLSPFLDAGHFRTCDYDVLMAPWRAAIDGCQRSIVALSMMSAAVEGDDAWWAIVDTVLAE